MRIENRKKMKKEKKKLKLQSNFTSPLSFGWVGVWWLVGWMVHSHHIIMKSYKNLKFNISCFYFPSWFPILIPSVKDIRWLVSRSRYIKLNTKWKWKTYRGCIFYSIKGDGYIRMNCGLSVSREILFYFQPATKEWGDKIYSILPLYFLHHSLLLYIILLKFYLTRKLNEKWNTRLPASAQPPNLSQTVTTSIIQ